MYHLATDRDTLRDYSDGQIDLDGYVQPEGLVYFSSVLRFYLDHRPAERLLAAPAPDSPLAQLLSRLGKSSGHY